MRAAAANADRRCRGVRRERETAKATAFPGLWPKRNKIGQERPHIVPRGNTTRCEPEGRAEGLEAAAELSGAADQGLLPAKAEMQGKMVAALLQGRAATMAARTSRALPGERLISKGRTLSTFSESENKSSSGSQHSV